MMLPTQTELPCTLLFNLAEPDAFRNMRDRMEAAEQLKIPFTVKTIEGKSAVNNTHYKYELTLGELTKT